MTTIDDILSPSGAALLNSISQIPPSDKQADRKSKRANAALHSFEEA